ncbi:MAG: Glycosyl transferase family 2 [Parcubacteria group bacterium GW2011_GWC2_45_7]|nr:MAG: Glycosyl transferase family 2 [Parcubacteria group bacterium GW2011_GWC2_45_7]KKU71624.1 MAG: Glycosyl transferase family 2 [Parcubacteria group bacterium GW2011_GWA2_47_26]
MKVAAIVPAFNEEKTIGGVVRVLKKSPFIGEVIVISDGSRDRTAEAAREAGADLVHELPWRHGKGSAMSHGVTHTDSPVLFFADADLNGFTVKHIDGVVKPVLEGKYAMVVGLRDRGRFLMWLSQFLPLIGGERAMLRKVFTDIPDYFLKGFKAESALNYYCRANKLSYGTVPMHGIKIVRKMQKFGFWGGLKEYFKMSWQILKAMTEVRFNRKVFITRGAHLKHVHTQ